MKINIDGSKLEGGGQILRMSSALSCILNIPISVTNIRGNRSKPGLKAQHLTGLQLLKSLSNAELVGGKMNSMEIDFTPDDVVGGPLTADTKTAGSVSLLIQSVLPCSLFGKKESIFTLKGGTNAEMAPQIDYTLMVFKEICAKFGVSFELSVNKRGFFPVGKGEVTLRVSPLKECLKPIEMLDQGQVVNIKGQSFVAGVLPTKMAHQMADSAERELKKALGSNTRIDIERFKESPAKAVGNGSCIILWAETSTGCFLGSSSLGKRGVSPEQVGGQAAGDLIQCLLSKSCVDSHCQDQVVLFMALAKGKSSIRTSELTLHTQTAIHVAELMTKAKFNTIEEKETGTIILECEGIGLEPSATQ
ncbi:UNVERIFIED_CONTAM: hypothetical protein RMT77_016549 [Armadillidium vulgare]